MSFWDLTEAALYRGLIQFHKEATAHAADIHGTNVAQAAPTILGPYPASSSWLRSLLNESRDIGAPVITDEISAAPRKALICVPASFQASAHH
jgi:hypothetical protein